MRSRSVIRALLCSTLVLAGLVLVPTSAVALSCVSSTPAQHYDRAEVVVEGTFTEGPTDSNGNLYRPAAFDVARYVKGSGPMQLSVQAGTFRSADGSEGSIAGEMQPRAGESWRLYGSTNDDGSLETSVCSGSTRIRTTYAAACPSDVPEDGLRDIAPYDVQEPAIDCAVHRELVRGVGDGLFAPDRATSRAQLASAMAAAMASTGAALPADPPDAFDDDEGPFERAIDQLAALGLVKGTGPRTFSPDAGVTRAQTATLLVHAQETASGEELPRGGDRFSDDDGSPHEQSIDKAADAGFMGATGNGTFAPDVVLPRRQLASVLVRWVDLRVR